MCISSRPFHTRFLDTFVSLQTFSYLADVAKQIEGVTDRKPNSYAWFTMSREVALEGIQMTATVPEGIQISLGTGTNTSAGLTTSGGATLDTGTSSTNTNRLTAVGAPTLDTEWSNIIDVSEYYRFGRLTPATSTNGSDIFFTKDISGVGRTLNGQSVSDGGFSSSAVSAITANFTKADTTDTLNAANAAAAVGLINNRGASILPTDDTTEGYYIDIPVWFRTSMTSEVELAVKASFSRGNNDYVTANTSGSGENLTEGDMLYKSARVSILKGNGSGTGAGYAAYSSTATLTQGVIADSSTYYYRTNAGAQLNSSAAGTATTNEGTVNAAGVANTADNWDDVTRVTQYTTLDAAGKATSTADTVVAVQATTAGESWGAATPYTIRVWLDGEDVNCWNATAGQDFVISLSFAQKAAAASVGG